MLELIFFRSALAVLCWALHCRLNGLWNPISIVQKHYSAHLEVYISPDLPTCSVWVESLTYFSPLNSIPFLLTPSLSLALSPVLLSFSLSLFLSLSYPLLLSSITWFVEITWYEFQTRMPRLLSYCRIYYFHHSACSHDKTLHKSSQKMLVDIFSVSLFTKLLGL